MLNFVVTGGYGKQLRRSAVPLGAAARGGKTGRRGKEVEDCSNHCWTMPGRWQLPKFYCGSSPSFPKDLAKGVPSRSCVHTNMSKTSSVHTKMATSSVS